MITIDEAKKLTYHQTIYHARYKNSDGTPERWKVNGAVRTWKTKPDKVLVPLKRGLYQYGYLTESDLEDFNLSEKP